MRKLIILIFIVLLFVSLVSAQVLQSEEKIFNGNEYGLKQNDACEPNQKKCNGLKVYYCSAGSWRLEDKCALNEDVCVVQLGGCVKKTELSKLMEAKNLVYDENGTIVEGTANKPILINNTETNIDDVVDENAPLLIPYEQGQSEVQPEEVQTGVFENYLIQEDGDSKIIKKNVDEGFNFEFTTKEDVHKENGEMYILKDDRKYYVKFTPEDVLGNLFPATEDQITLKSNELVLYQDIAAFKIVQTVRGKFLGFIPANAKVTYYVNSENNELMRKAKPWYMKVE